MESVFPLGNRGKVVLQWENEVAEAIAEMPDDRAGLYKVWLRGNDGGGILLGTLTPEKGRLVQRRRFSIKELELNGCWPIKECRLKLVYPFENRNWYREQHPERLIADPILRKQVNGAMMCCRAGERTFLAVPFQRERPIGLDAVFCFGKVEMVQGILHIVWTFDKNGRLEIPKGHGDCIRCENRKDEGLPNCYDV